MSKPKPTRKPKIRRLFVDIETAPLLALIFSTGYNLNINHDAIVGERKIICIGISWDGEKKVRVLRWDKNQDDKSMLIEFLKIAEEADEVAGHYAAHFDIPWIRTRCLIHGLDPVPIYKMVDTKALASRYFFFTSNKLDYISKVLGFGGKIKTDFELWKAIVWDKDPAALNRMCAYCSRDVVRLKQVFHAMQNYVPARTHVGVLAGNDVWSCPHCGSRSVRHDKRRATAHGTVQHQLRCQKCLSYFTISDRANQEHQEYLRKK